MTEHQGEEPIEEERTAGAAGAILLAGLVLLLGIRGSWSAVAIVFAIVLMIFMHELGHYLTAKSAGMKVTEFFLGFGPKLWSFQRGETEYGIKAIPAGAYVKIIGMSNLDEVDPADEDRTYRAKPYWRRLSVAVAGSTMHFLMAFVLICVVLMGFGTPQSSLDLGLHTVAGPALHAGLRPGDRLVSIDGKHYRSFDAMSAAVHELPGQQVAVVVERKGALRTFTATLGTRNPVTGQRVGYLGVSPSAELVRTGGLAGVVEGVKTMGTTAKESVVGLGRVFSPSGITRYVDNLTTTEKAGTGTAAASRQQDRPTSMVGIVQIGSQAAKDGIVNVLYLLFVVNMFIGLFNLTPLLPFDGGHVVIATYEKVRSMIAGRRYQADVAKLMPLTYAVVMLLGLLFITSIYLDIAKPISLR